MVDKLISSEPNAVKVFDIDLSEEMREGSKAELSNSDTGEMLDDSGSSDNLLDIFKEALEEEFKELVATERKVVPSEITLNGTPMMVASTPVNSDVSVYLAASVGTNVRR